MDILDRIYRCKTRYIDIKIDIFDNSFFQKKINTYYISPEKKMEIYRGEFLN